jgi:hypothetical protein
LCFAIAAVLPAPDRRAAAEEARLALLCIALPRRMTHRFHQVHVGHLFSTVLASLSSNRLSLVVPYNKKLSQPRNAIISCIAIQKGKFGAFRGRLSPPPDAFSEHSKSALPAARAAGLSTSRHCTHAAAARRHEGVST